LHIGYSRQEVAFRKEVSEFLSQGAVVDLRLKTANYEELTKQDLVRWHKALYERGWAAPNWPKELGGTGWSPVQKHIFLEEVLSAGLSTLSPFGISMVAPVIFTYGTEAQIERFLPGILSGDTWWCQGYSEPGAGSDLASVKTSAVRYDDHYLVNGMKTWTTHGHLADWIFCLVRTDKHVAKQRGISFLLIDLKSPGVEIRPIITLDGAHEINEIWFSNVEVPAENLIGEENQGWTYAKSLLMHERTGIAGVAWCADRIHRLKRFITDSEWDDPGQSAALAKKIAEVEIELKALDLTDLRTLAGIKTGQAPGPESSILKIKGTEIQQRITELFQQAAGYFGIPMDVEQGQYDEGFLHSQLYSRVAMSEVRTYLNFRKTTIYGGSTEIQKNIIAKAVLGL
jgi:alkylation response protein AidB-like acyl-CoA dehydrogenase